jgi:hypothetical protein
MNNARRNSPALPRRPRDLALAAFALAAVTAALSASCAGLDDPVVLATPELDAGPVPPPFVPTEDAGDVADVDASALRCIATECPYPYATCPSADPNARPPFKCQHDLLTDNENCGACGNQCPAYPEFGLLGHCSNGICEPQCEGQRRDCNHRADDGCEVEILFDSANCGFCGNACAPGERCREGICGCPAGKTDCNGACVDLSTDDFNCGVCQNYCTVPEDAGAPPPNMHYGCSGGKCGQLICDGSWRNCNGDLEDGCELDVEQEIEPGLLDPKHCGACGVECAPGEECRRIVGGDIVCRCKPNQTMCGFPGNYACTDISSDPKHCGLCNHACPFEGRRGLHQQATCTKGVCGTECEAGWGDCNDNPADGCETNLRYDGANCGACGNRCNNGLGQPCIDGRCLTVECDAGNPVTR